MSVTISNLKTALNSYIGDSSTDRISEAERYAFLTESVAWLSEELGNEHMVNTSTINFIDGVNYYKINTSVSDLLTGADLRRQGLDQVISAARKSPRELAEEIGQRSSEFCWAVDRYDGDTYLGITMEPKYKAQMLASFDSATSDGGTWTLDSVDSDATNLTYDVNEKEEGAASLNFDVDVSQSGNNLSTIYISKSSSVNLSSLEDVGSFLLRVYIPDATETTSVRLRFSSDASGTPSTITNYWSITATTGVNSAPIVAGWNRIKFDWNSATVVGSPDSEDISYYQIDINYGASQADDTDYRLDELTVAKTERLTFHYVSWNVGTTTLGVPISVFTADTDIPFFSGLYDPYKHAVAHKAASLIYFSPLRNKDQGMVEEKEAVASLDRYRKRFESSMTREEKSFKVKGINLRNRRRNYRR